MNSEGVTLFARPLSLPRLVAFAIGGAVVSAAIGLAVYPGNLAVFVLFSMTFLTIAAAGFLRPLSYAHMFLGLMWLIGFWIKFVLHERLSWPYNEPSGDFQAIADGWNFVLLVCSIGGLGFLAGRLAILPWAAPRLAQWSAQIGHYPVWYPRWSVALSYFAIAVVVAIVVLNWSLGIYVRGFVTQIVLPWPLGGLFAWTTDIGLALAISVLAAWDRQAGLTIIRNFVTLCIEGVMMSLSTVSRASFIAHTLPFIVSVMTTLRRPSMGVSVVTLMAIWLVLAAAMPAATTFLRLFSANAVPVVPEEFTTGVYDRSSVLTGNVLMDQSIILARLLIIDRWTGLEGVMAASAYPHKGSSLLSQAAFERRSYGSVDVYTREIAKSPFTPAAAQRFHYASPSGPIAFFYFSGSLWVVLLGMMVLAAIVTMFEVLWTWLLRDPIPLALSGWYLAFWVLQFGGGLQQAITGPAMITLLFAAAYMLTRMSRPAGRPNRMSAA